MVVSPDKIELTANGKQSLTVKLSLSHLVFLAILAFSTIISVVATTERLGHRIDLLAGVVSLQSKSLDDHEDRLRLLERMRKREE